MSSLHALVNAPYPDCPSAGYEWLRFGRLLESDTTATIEAAKPAHSLNPYCLSDDDYGKFKRHNSALAFWEEAKAAGLELDTTHVHLHPGRFIETFRKCGWLSESEFTQLLPTEVLNEYGHTVYIESVIIDRDRKTIIGNHRVPLNKALRKYRINTASRMATFYGNALVESQWLQKLHENNTTQRYYPWDGRGFLQLTWPDSYIGYWDFRGLGTQITKPIRDALAKAQHQADLHNDQSYLADTASGVTQLMLDLRNQASADSRPLTDEDKLTPSDSAGFYWSKMGMARYADRAIALERRVVSAIHHPAPHHPQAPNPAINKIYYHDISFRDASATVNLPAAVGHPEKPFNGYIARCVAYANALTVLGETMLPDGTGAFTQVFPEGSAPRRD